MIETVRARPAARVATHPWLLDGVLLGGLTILIGLVYRIVDAPLYNPYSSIDAWVYAGLFTNFDFTYHHFGFTYYASRLPWIVPNLVAHDVFSWRVAYFIVHGAFFFGGGIALFVLVRRFLGRLPAFVAYAALVANQLFYLGETWEYVDGAIITYFLVAFAFGITETGGRRRVPAMFAAGFFLAAAVATNIFVSVLALGFPLLYAAVNPLRGHARRLLSDGLAFVSGSALLVLAGCIFSKVNGNGWWFLGPQIRAAGTLSAKTYRSATYGWVVHQPRLIAPLLVLVLGGLVLPRLPRRDPQQRIRFRFAVACYAYLLFSAGFLTIYELTGGAVLEYPYYESLIFPAMALALASVVFAAAEVVHGRAARAGVLLVVVGAVALPLLLVYPRDHKGLVGPTGTWLALGAGAVMVVFALGDLGLRSSARARAAAAIAAVGLLVFGVNFSTASSADVYDKIAAYPENGPVYDVGMQLIAFMRTGGFQREVPYFWYSMNDGVEGLEFEELQSLYFFSYTYLGVNMPTVDADFVARARLYRPQTIVLLCRSFACLGGPRALHEHGYALREVGRRLLTSGAFSVWVRVYHVTRSPPRNPGG
ncbi:MAG: hypothetical protein ACTHMY_08865 [Solirubrobacteraceae bacterium]